MKHKRVSRSFLKLVYLVVAIIALAFLVWGIKKYRNAEKETFAEVPAYVVRGIDLSHHNEIVEPQKLLNESVSFVYLKATEGTDHLDRNFTINYQQLRSVGIRVGAYHFYSFGVSGKLQASHFIQTAKLQSPDLIPAIDVEHSPTNPYSTDTAYVNKVIYELKVLEEELHQYYGKKPLIYTNKECYRLYIEKNFPDNLLWVVDLHNEPPLEIKNWRIWQFSHQGRVKGVNGKVDLNYYRYTLKEFDEMLLP